MARVKRGVMHTKRRRNWLQQTKGFKWGRKSRITLAKTAATKAGVYAYRDRRNKKREFRKLWQIRINAAAHGTGTTYSKLTHALKTKNIALDRKILATLAMDYPKVFEKVVASTAK
ncbi:MAG: 50S ribosomal protein L20 [bacterium]|nr:50S ribosomal protein L20 [bacterium]